MGVVCCKICFEHVDAKCVTQIVGRGMGGIQGPCYMGTGCFHRRKLVYAFSLDDTDIQGLYYFLQ